MPHVRASTIPAVTATLNARLHTLLEARSALPHPDLVLDFERDLHALGRWWADSIFASWLAFLLEHTDFEARVVAARRAVSERTFKTKGRRDVELKLLGGHCFLLSVRVLRPLRRAGRPRAHGRRGRGKGHQATPTLQALGFARRASPALAAQKLELSASCESIESARRTARARGIAQSQSTWLKQLEVTSTLAQDALNQWLDEPLEDGPLEQVCAAGHRIVIGFDGGRLRERVDKRGRKKSNGYRDFKADWVEPRQLVVYAIDEQGKRLKSWGKLAHASLAPREQMFAQMRKLFENIEIDKAERVIITADGQHWQWDELRQMLLDANVQASKIVEVLDMCHALGRLGEIAHKPARWKQGARSRWFSEGKKRLKSGDVDGLISYCLELAAGSRAKSVKSLTSYFEKHRERMDYASFKTQGIPTGSGAVESMIRQVVNMRLKSCGKFWKRPNAERMLMLRSWWVVGRLEDLWRFSLRQRVSWWKPTQVQGSCAFDYAPLFS